MSGEKLTVSVSDVVSAVVTRHEKTDNVTPALATPGSKFCVCTVVQVFDFESEIPPVDEAPFVPALSAATMANTVFPTANDAVSVTVKDDDDVVELALPASVIVRATKGYLFSPATESAW